MGRAAAWLGLGWWDSLGVGGCWGLLGAALLGSGLWALGSGLWAGLGAGLGSRVY